MAIKKLKGIVISEQAYSESSKILKIFTKDLGIISVLSKGCRKPKSPFHQASNKLVYATFDISYKEKGLSTLIAVDIIDYFKNICYDYTDLEKKLAAFLISDVIVQILNQKQITNDEEKEIYDIFLSSLLKLNECLNPVVITQIVRLKLLDYLGVKPSIDACSICGSSKDIVTMDYSCYGFLCKNCHTNEKLTKENSLKTLRMLYYVDIDKIKTLNIDEEEITDIESFISEYYENNTGIFINNKRYNYTTKDILKKQD